MDNSQIFAHVDHTQLKAAATWQDIQKLCDDAVQYQTASVCIPPSYVAPIHKEYADRVRICTVVGFPLGYSTTEAKVREVECALRDGAQEIDMVINIGMVKNGQFAAVQQEIAALKAACGSHVLKVIIETCYLTDTEKEQLCACVRGGGADYIKTSTGFGTASATLADIQLFRRCLGDCGVKIKAAGGIKTRDDMVAFLKAGCDRLGTSSAVSLLVDQMAVASY